MEYATLVSVHTKPFYICIPPGNGARPIRYLVKSGQKLTLPMDTALIAYRMYRKELTSLDIERYLQLEKKREVQGEKAVEKAINDAVKQVQKSKPIVHECPVCQKPYEKIGALRTHMKLRHKGAVNANQNEG